MNRFETGCRSFEVALHDKGMPAIVLVHSIAQPSDPSFDPWNYLTLELVVPMGEEVHVRELILDEVDSLEGWFGTQPQFVIRTILHHFAYSVFGQAAEPQRGILISTNVHNIETPTRRQVKNDGIAYFYSLRIVVIESRRSEAAVRPTVDRISTLAKGFNRNSRFLKIGSLHWAVASSRLLSTREPQLSFHEISLR
jgi:hypothetical protein